MPKTFFIFVCLFSFSIPVYSLQESEINFVYSLLKKKGEFYQLGDFTGSKGVTLKYGKFGREKGKKGSVVFVNGRSETILKYTELFYDLIQEGYSPIYTYDHRGQGLSERLLEDPLLGHVESYDYYVNDLKTFIENIVLKDSDANQDRLFLMAHSMGGGISARYLQEHSNSGVFRAALLSAPLFKVQTGMNSFVEGMALKLFKLICKYDCTQESWKPSPKEETREEVMSQLTTSKVRFDFFEHLREKYPEIILGNPTYQWIIQTFRMTKKLIKVTNIQKISTPVLIFSATRDDLVRNDYHKRFCEAHPKCCSLKEVDSEHEVFLEVDSVRNPSLKRVFKFFSESDDLQENCHALVNR